MKPNKRRWLLLIGGVCLLLCFATVCGALLAWRGDWRYRIGLNFRRYEDPALTAGVPSGELCERSLEELFSDPRVAVTSDLLLIGPSHPIPGEFSPALTDEGGIPMAEEVLRAFREMNGYVQAETGEKLFVRSAWRSAEEQQKEWEAGGSKKLASEPGYSEHQTGLALDVCTAGYGGMAFLKTSAGRLVNDTCWKFGFIVRYPQGKQNETGAVYEPWHLRYVGTPHAEIIMNAGITLESYAELFVPDTWYRSGEYFILRTASPSVCVPPQFASCVASPDNLGYWILTFKLS